MTRTPRLLALLSAVVVALVALAGIALTGPTATAASAPDRTTPSLGRAATFAASITYRNVQKRERIPLSVRTVRTDKLPKGKRKVDRWGHPGTRVITYRVKYRDGTAVSARKVRTRVVRQPLSRIVLVGTRARSTGGGGSDCSPHYRGGCVPIASDVDCAGGSGNGPRYVSGPVYVVDYDIYDLDSDGDGVGCE